MLKTTQPLTKFIRTLEGWLVVAFNLVIAAASVFGSLPGSQALKWGGIVTTAAIVARSGLKAVASLSSTTGPPIMPTSVTYGTGNTATGITITTPVVGESLPTDTQEAASTPTDLAPPPVPPAPLAEPESTS